MNISTVVASVLAFLTCKASAFAPSFRTAPSAESITRLNADKPVTYGEASRPFRRDTFGHDDWIRHRSPKRFARNLGSIFKSGIWRQVGQEVLTVTAIATSICLWNALASTGYVDLNGIFWSPVVYEPLPAVSLPVMPFTLTSPALSLLLVFRTNASYGRWNESRIQWGVMGTEQRNIMRMAAAWTTPLREPDPEKRKAHVARVGNACYTFFRSLLRHISGPPDEEDFQRDIRAALPEKEAEAIIAAGNRQLRALFYLSRKIESLPLSERQRIEVDKACVIIGDTMGGTERVYGTPVPLSYTRHTSRFLTTWLLLLPLALYEPFAYTWNHIGMIPASALIAGFLFGIEEISIMLEEPFSILALPGMVASMKGFSEQLPEWHAYYTNDEYNSNVYGGEESWKWQETVLKGKELAYLDETSPLSSNGSTNGSATSFSPDFSAAPAEVAEPAPAPVAPTISATEELQIMINEMGALRGMVQDQGVELEDLRGKVVELREYANHLQSRSAEPGVDQYEMQTQLYYIKNQLEEIASYL